MGNNYEQEFINHVADDISNSAAKQASKIPRFNKVSIIIIVILLLIVVIETVAVIIAFSKNGQDVEAEVPEEAINDTELDQPFTTNEFYTYDDSDNLKSFNLDCSSEDGARYVFTNANAYTEYDSKKTEISSGTYNIIHDGVVILKDTKNTEQVVYFDGFDIYKGTTAFTCNNNTD